VNPNKTADLDYRRLVRDSRRIEESSDRHRVRIALLSDAATQQFIPVLKTLFSENGVTAELYEAPFDAMELEVINPASGLYAFEPDVVLLIHSIQALRARYYEQGMSPEFDRMLRIWDALAANSAARIVQCNFPLPYERPFGQFDQKLQQSLYAETRLLNARIALAAGERANVLVCDIESVASYVGRKHWFDERLWDMSKTFCSLEFLPQAAQAMVDLVLAGLGRIVKCVILDLDNTLWGGVVGDLGPMHVEIGPHGDGEAFYRLQKFLLSLKKRGIVLAVCSKNELSNALAVFEQNPGMVLKRDDIAVFAVNWDNKADNIRAIRDTLEIGFDSLLFLDDNAFERNLVRNFLPEVIVPELPDDPADYVRAVAELNLFETTAFSAEDAARSESYRQEADRRQAQNSYTDVSEFLKSLDMRIRVGRFEPAQIGRISQLFLRSNQFNLTTHRYTEAECTAMMEDEHCIPLCASLSDRFGDHGLISIVVAWPQGDLMRISDWLMSCRVLGRGVEEYLMNHLFSMARERGVRRVSGEYLPSAKNGMVKDFWRRFGFENTAGALWEIEVSAYVPGTTWINPAGIDSESEKHD
jgi:FkbH-like protein